MTNTSKVCITVGGVAWLIAVVVLAIFGQPEMALALAICGCYALMVLAFFR